MISSQTNAQVKYVRRLQNERRRRQRDQCFVVEGTRWLQELLQQQVVPRTLFFTPTWESAHAEILLQFAESSQIVGQAVSEAVMATMSDTETPAGVLAVVDTPQRTLPPDADWLLILDGIGTPGNMGTMLRTAAAAGVDGVLLAPGCVDPTNPKVVRGTMGALLRVPLIQASWEAIGEMASSLAVWVATLEGEVAYTAVAWHQPSALIIGSEAGGAGSAARTLARGEITIPMEADTESLNAAIASGIILFEARRQRLLRLTG